MIRDLVGFGWKGAEWSWPEFDQLGALVMPAHALAPEHQTACGQPWPHVWISRAGLEQQRLKWDGDERQRGIAWVPTKDQQTEIRGYPGLYLCDRCCRLRKVQHAQAGPAGELP